jgi:hypothetical protein
VMLTGRSLGMGLPRNNGSYSRFFGQPFECGR